MGLLDKLLSKSIDEPIFVKDYDSESNKQLMQLNQLLDKVGDDQKSLIENEIKLIQIGLLGERNVAYELKNSFLPIICLHDIRLEYRDYSAQFDFIVISSKCIFVLETKKLTGDIIIDNSGNFIRAYKDFKGNVYKKEGINSPVSQNEKHVDILQRFLKDNKLGKNIPIASLVVIANPKTIINFKYTKKEIRDIIIKHDQIKLKILDVCNSLSRSHISLSNKEMLNLADFLLTNDRPIQYDYIKRFNLKIKEIPKVAPLLEPDVIIEEDSSIENANQDKKPQSNLDDSLFESLKAYRINKAKEMNVPLYFIYSNEQLSSLVLNRPRSKEEFINISGFGDKKYENFGQDVINIIWGTDGISDKVENDNQLNQKLKEYRLNQSKLEKIKPYMIFNNEDLETLCNNKPTNKNEFIALKGFGEKKYEKYGSSIIEIINKYS